MHYCYVLVNLDAIIWYCYELRGCAQRIRCVLCMIEMLNGVLHFGCCWGIMMICIENNKSNGNLAKTIKNKNFHRLEVVRWNRCIIKCCDVEDFCKEQCWCHTSIILFFFFAKHQLNSFVSAFAATLISWFAQLLH